jgi:hypothetical protein
MLQRLHLLHRCDIGGPAPVEMYSGCRCGRGEPSPAQTWQGQPPQCLPAAVLHAVPTVLAVLRHALRTADRRRRRNAAALGHRWMLPRCMAMPWSRSAIRGASTRVDLIRVALVRCCLEKKLLRLCANPCVGEWVGERVCGCVGVWVRGCVSGCLGVWECERACGCVGVWVCACVHAHVPERPMVFRTSPCVRARPCSQQAVQGTPGTPGSAGTPGVPGSVALAHGRFRPSARRAL